MHYFSSLKPFLWAVSPTFAVLSQAVGSGVLIEWFEIFGFSRILFKK
jgi:hypothetical protein